MDTVIFNNSKEALIHIMKEHKVDGLLGTHGKQLFRDYVPEAPSQSTMYDRVLVCSFYDEGVAAILYVAHTRTYEEKRQAGEQAVSKLTGVSTGKNGLITKTDAQRIVTEFMNALGWYDFGDDFQFGPYKWHIVEVQADRALLLAEDVIEERPYNIQSNNVTWENCTLRQYLNGDFYRSFSTSEQSQILKTTSSTANNSEFGSAGGNPAADHIFLLSVEEVEKYMGTWSMDKIGKYAEKVQTLIANNEFDKINSDEIGEYERNMFKLANHEEKPAYWWLRTPGKDNGSAVCALGEIFLEGGVVDKNAGIRPALWIKRSDVKIGQKDVKFGSYEWIALDKVGDRTLLITKDIIEVRQYNAVPATTWETSTLRQYLNGEFFQKFTELEQYRILSIANTTAANSQFGTSGGDSTIDKVFLFGIEEVLKYMGDYSQAETFAKSDEMDSLSQDEMVNLALKVQGFRLKIAKYEDRPHWWWLRSSGSNNGNAAVVYEKIKYDGVNVDNASGGVRPALWMKI